jgi:hypothetical protein
VLNSHAFPRSPSSEHGVENQLVVDPQQVHFVYHLNYSNHASTPCYNDTVIRATSEHSRNSLRTFISYARRVVGNILYYNLLIQCYIHLTTPIELTETLDRSIRGVDHQIVTSIYASRWHDSSRTRLPAKRSNMWRLPHEFRVAKEATTHSQMACAPCRSECQKKGSGTP